MPVSTTTSLPGIDSFTLDVRANTVHIEWETAADNGEVRFDTRNADNGGGWITKTTAPFDTDGVSLDGLANGDTWEIRARTQTDDTESEWVTETLLSLTLPLESLDVATSLREVAESSIDHDQTITAVANP